jgi:lysine 2,3-aminomutase
MTFFENAKQTQEWQDWQWQLANAVRHPAILGPEFAQLAAAARQRYPMFATPHYLSLAGSADPADPILRQCLPDAAELAGQDGQGGCPDPLAEGKSSPVPHLIHRYADRALLVTTSNCAVRCRHCMRKRLWDQPGFLITPQQAGQALDYVAATPTIRELIISGGDPLLLDDDFLDWLLERAFAIPTLEMVRIGTRVPVALPQRLTPRFCALLGRHGPVWVVTHFNHPQEFSPAADAGILNLLHAGVPVLNQAVLLKGVNDDPEILRQLFTGLLRRRVKPYYLFHGDPVEGTLHFRTGTARGLEILEALRGRVSGLALPHYAIDLPDGGGKIRLAPDCACGRLPDSTTTVYRSWDGREIPYLDGNAV